MLSSSIFVFPFVVAIKPSQVSPCSSKSLATQDTPVRILRSSNDIHFPATSSLFHGGTVSSSVQPSAFPSSSVRTEGKARNVFFQSCKLFLSRYFSVNSSSADLPRFSSKSVLSGRSVDPRSQDLNNLTALTDFFKFFIGMPMVQTDVWSVYGHVITL